MNIKFATAHAAAVLLSASLSTSTTQARDLRTARSSAAGQNFAMRTGGSTGRVAANRHAQAFTGPYGGKWVGGAGAIGGPNAGIAGYGFKGTGPNGGTGQGAGLAGWKRGVGGFEGTQMSLKGAKGNTYSGFTRGKYNAQTGQGTYNASRQFHDAQTGKNTGWTNDTTYNNGKGVSQMDTDNHGDYTIDWGKGQKPVLIKDSAGK